MNLYQVSIKESVYNSDTHLSWHQRFFGITKTLGQWLSIALFCYLMLIYLFERADPLCIIP